MNEIRKILVTGTQRSGTTWLGTILSSNPTVGYIHEPFNTVNVALHNSPISIPYQYIGITGNLYPGSIVDYLDYFTHPGLRFFFNSIFPIGSIDSRYLIPGHQYILNGFQAKTQIIKDPFALLSAEWLHNTLNWEIVITIRHPAAFALSMKEKNWIVTPTVFLKQIKEMFHIYGEYNKLVFEYLNKNDKRPDLIGSAILGWNLLHIAILYYKKKYPYWHYLRHEDLSMEPVKRFNDLFLKLNLKFTDKPRNKVLSSSSGKSTDGKFRDSSVNAKKWKQRLTEVEIHRIKQATSPFWHEFYTEADW